MWKRQTQNQSLVLDNLISLIRNVGSKPFGGVHIHKEKEEEKNVNKLYLHLVQKSLSVIHCSFINLYNIAKSKYDILGV